jgi:hypothetical protein
MYIGRSPGQGGGHILKLQLKSGSHLTHVKFPRIFGGPVKVPTFFGGHLILFIGTRCKILPLLRSRQIFMPKVKPLAMGFYHV